MECLSHKLIPASTPPLKSGVDGLALFEKNARSPKAKLYYNLEETTCPSSLIEYVNERAPLCCVTGRRFSFDSQICLIQHARSLNLGFRHWISKEALDAFFNKSVTIRDGSIPAVLRLGQKEWYPKEYMVTPRNHWKTTVPFFNSEQTTNPELTESRTDAPLMKNYSTGKVFPLAVQHQLFVFARKQGFLSSLWVDEKIIANIEQKRRRVMLMVKPKQTASRLRMKDSPNAIKYYNVDQLTDPNYFYKKFQSGYFRDPTRDGNVH
ncbi:hypothetical protein XU18_1765 [Perkinsela sp. CCAP 1560/4]|nr:hypothetical protein XU18_3699 [Perkinsela sp. CCAP 1560/4]KNH07588.1 hypothetical protein XU18_1765 [Perkinsela sp. CCAP 1560/4]|eukprot:KNH05241.1 hypothetical protein XU18_3699 [Perkinsela sp. CCAP 1560/4]